MARYDRELWFKIAPLLDFLPDDKRAEALEILQEGEVASDHAITVATDIADTGFRQLGNGVCLRRRGWLKATDFRQDVQTRVLDMPFDGNNLFGKAVDDSLQAIKADTETARALGTLQQRRTPFRSSGGKGASKGSGGGFASYRQAARSSSQEAYRGRGKSGGPRRRRQGGQGGKAASKQD